MKREALSLKWLEGRVRRYLKQHGPPLPGSTILQFIKEANDHSEGLAIPIDEGAPVGEAMESILDPGSLETVDIEIKGRPKYGDFREHFETVGRLWSAFIEARTGMAGTVRPQDVPVMMQLLKIARIATGIPLADNQLDIKGYGSLYDQLMGLDNKCGQQEAGQASSSVDNSGRRAKDSPPRGSRKNAKGSMSQPRTRARKRGTRRDT